MIHTTSHLSHDCHAHEELPVISRGEADEVIIVRRALITDTSYSNLAFRSRGQWYTPATPLLRGTMRESLLACGLLREANITPADLPLYDAVCLINAMMSLGRMTLPIDSII
jgi:4-amino-4-deoxychorismate lyase